MFNYDFMQNAFFVAVCISLLCPCIGIFMVLRRSSMIGDTMSHRIPRRNYPRSIDQYEPYIRGFHIHRYLRRSYRVLAKILFLIILI